MDAGPNPPWRMVPCRKHGGCKKKNTPKHHFAAFGPVPEIMWNHNLLRFLKENTHYPPLFLPFFLSSLIPQFPPQGNGVVFRLTSVFSLQSSSLLPLAIPHTSFLRNRCHGGETSGGEGLGRRCKGLEHPPPPDLPSRKNLVVILCSTAPPLWFEWERRDTMQH